MKQPSSSDIAREIIAQNRHLTLATAGDTPWAAPLFYCSDDRLNLFFASQYSSLHSRHIKENSQVAFAIYDSQQYHNGVQGLGTAEMLKGADILKALHWYKTDFFSLSLKTLSGAAKYRLYRITPEKLYVQDPRSSTDRRVEVPLSELLP